MKCPEAVCENHDGERGDCGLHIYLYKLIKNVIMENSTKRLLKKWHALVAIFFLAAFATNVQAQNVTISPQNGSMICALTGSDGANQLGFQIGAFGTWRHNQLSLTMTGSNYSDLTEDGQLASHSNHFITGDKCTFSPADATRTPSKYIVADWGGSNLRTGYITIALPKGYRFTSYTFHISHDVSMFGQNNTAFNLTTNTNVFMTETNNDFSGNKNRVTLAGASAAVSEFKRTGDDMGNVLYFTTSANSDGFYAVTFRYIELTFTADADASISLLPGSQVSTGASLLEVPFNTGKVDLGEIKQGSYNGATRVSYQFNTVTDMPANMLLYEKESVKDGTGFDGTSGKVAYNQTGHSITTIGHYFKFAPDASKKEQVYFLETPVSAMMAGNIENPVQFRITGATINYTNEASESFYIQYTDGGTTYYLGTNGQFSRTSTAWKIDSDGHIYSGNDYLTGTNSWVNVTQTKNSATTFTISGTTITNASGNTLKYFNYGGTRYGYFTNNTTLSDYWNTYNVYPAEVEYAEGSSVADYTIYVYDKEGKNPKEINITGTGSYPLPDLNNDAIKFGVKGGDVALLNFTLKLQALNPYIDQMTVVMNDTDHGKNLRMTQTFTADDFSVGGGTFRFYLPTDCKGDDISMTFEDLYSKYGDETYDHTTERGNSNSRYNFVKSQHNLAFTNDNIYNAYDEAASATLESERITNKQNIRTQVGTVGNQAFRFNNADELATHSGYMTEYPFTLEKYANQTNPGRGQFIAASFVDIDGTLDDPDRETFYVFTTDETRYNIAPTTATQHRFYAFYEMIVEMVCENYDPIVTFEKIYDKTLYANGSSDVSGEAFYGVKVTAPSNIPNALASDVAVYKKISQGLGGTNAPADLKHILYLDMSALNGVYHSTASTADAAYAVSDFNELKNKFADNALVYLPINATATFDNFAYAKKGEVAGSFQSANNVIIKDKVPFYSPYDIQLGEANYVKYERKITWSTQGKNTLQTVLLPFTISVNGGKHTEEDGTAFTLNKMTADNCLSIDHAEDANAENFKAKAYFTPIDGTFSEANVPYMVEVTKAPNDANTPFVVTQKYATIKATTSMDANYLFKGETASGSINGAGYSFQNQGSYSGKELTAADGYFYYAGGMYLNSKNIRPEVSKKLLMYPFRAYYSYTGGSGAKMGFMEIVFGENETTAIDALARESVAIDENAPVYDLQGRMIAPSMKALAGKKLARGMYVVNGVKIIVK